MPFILQQTGHRERFWFWREDEGTGFTNANVDGTHWFAAPGHELGVNLEFTRGKEDEAYTRLLLRGSVELQGNYARYASRNVPQGRERARSSVDVLARKALMNERAELVFTFTDVFNDFALQHEIQGRGFTALYQNFLETQVPTVGIRYRF